jgi:hypothetical protein
MKTTLSTSAAAEILANDESSSFSRLGAYALVQHLEELEDSTGEEMEFDRVGIRCDFAEYDSLQDWADDYFGINSDWRVGKLGIPAADYDTERESEVIREYIQDRGQLIEFSGGIIVSSF